MAVHGAMEYKAVLSEVAACKTIILEVAICEVWTAVSSKSCPDIASKVAVDT